MGPASRPVISSVMVSLAEHIGPAAETVVKGFLQRRKQDGIRNCEEPLQIY